MKGRIFSRLFLLLLCCWCSLTAFAQTLKEDPVVGNRTITFVNKCSFPVWFGFISGATERKGGGAGCTTDADCNSGSVCVNRGAGGNQCFWKNPAPANGQFQLAANGGTNSVQIPIYANGQGAIWSGAVAGRTNCTSAGCETADCGGGTGACPSGRGFMQPATQAEFTFGKQSSDFYDVEVINGVNIPVEMAPNLSKAQRLGRCPNGLGGPCDNPYDCGNPGSPNPVTNFGRCNWNVTPPSNEYKWVQKGGAACTTDSNCTAPAVCGLSFEPAKTPRLQKTCGKLLGYWTANQACAMENNYGAPFNCKTPLPPPQQNLNLTNLYGCAPIGSCYQSGATNTCCGCANWDQLGIGVPPAPMTKQCVSSNPTWTSKVLPTLSWLKKACPSVYTYPYDDMSSTFTCRVNNASGVNNVNYTITYCPGGQTGGVGG